VLQEDKPVKMKRPSSGRPALSLSEEGGSGSSGASSNSSSGDSRGGGGQSIYSNSDSNSSGADGGISEREELVDANGSRGGGSDSDGPAPASHLVSPLAVSPESTAGPLPSPPLLPQEDLSKPDQFTTTTVAVAATAANGAHSIMAKIEEYWRLQAKKLSKGLLLPAVFEESCLHMVLQARDKGKISEEDADGLQVTFLRSLDAFNLPATATAASVEDCLRTCLEKLQCMYGKGSIGLSVLGDAYLGRLRDCHQLGQVTTTELLRLQGDFEKSQQELFL